MRNQAHLNQTLVNLESRNQYCIKQLAIKVCCGYDDHTNSLNGNRNRYTSGLFLSQIYTSYGEHRLKSIEFAIRSIRGNKASNRTNNTSLFSEVVEAVSHPIYLGDTLPQFTKTLNTMKNLTQSPSGNTAKSLYSVILTHKDGSTFGCAVNVSLERANQIKAEIEQRKARNAFGFHDLETITITSEKGGLYA